MKITGHKTTSVFQRYRIVSEGDIREALLRTQAANGQTTQEQRIVPIAKARKADG